MFIAQLGLIDYKKFLQVTTRKRFLLYFAKSMERLIHTILPACSKFKGKNISQLFVIIDLKSLKLKMLSKDLLNFLKLVANLASDYYPELLGEMYIINAPFMFSATFQIFKHWMDKRTASKIKVLRKKTTEVLLTKVITLSSIIIFRLIKSIYQDF